MVDVEAQYPRRVRELGEVRGDPRDGQQQRSHWSASRRAQAWRRAAGRSDPVNSMESAISAVHDFFEASALRLKAKPPEDVLASFHSFIERLLVQQMKI